MSNFFGGQFFGGGFFGAIAASTSTTTSGGGGGVKARWPDIVILHQIAVWRSELERRAERQKKTVKPAAAPAEIKARVLEVAEEEPVEIAKLLKAVVTGAKTLDQRLALLAKVEAAVIAHEERRQDEEEEEDILAIARMLH